MANATYLELVNGVLKRLREDTITTIAETPYAELIGIFVNEARREVEDAWQWNALKTTITFSTVVSQRDYDLTGSHSRTRILDAYNVTKKWPLGAFPDSMWINNILNATTTQSSSPTGYDFTQNDTTSGTLTVRLYPLPSAIESLTFYVINPQEDFSTGTEILRVPKDPVLQLAHLKAINERGEDQGRAAEIQERLYLKTLGDAIAQDAARTPEATVWVPV